MDGDPRAGKTFLRKQILKIQASSLMNVGLTSSQAEYRFSRFSNPICDFRLRKHFSGILQVKFVERQGPF